MAKSVICRTYLLCNNVAINRGPAHAWSGTQSTSTKWICSFPGAFLAHQSRNIGHNVEHRSRVLRTDYCSLGITFDAVARKNYALRQSNLQHQRQLSDQKSTKTSPSASEPSLATQEAFTETKSRNLPNIRERGKAIREKVLPSLPALTPYENIYNLPNILTVSRLIAAPATAYLLLHDHHKWALALFAYAGVTDLVDGWIARRWKLQTVAGSVIDPMADKALMIILTVTLAVKGAIPLYLATLILGLDASLAIAAIYYRFASLPAPKTFMRYWDFSLPSAEVHPTTVSKYNTFLQLILIGSTIALPVVSQGGAYAGLLHNVGLEDAALQKAMTAFQWLVAGTTTWSGLSYAFLKNAVTIIGPDEEMKKKQGARGRAIIGVTFGGVVASAVWIALTRDEITQAAEPKDDKNA